jgi:hypothetical protein
MTLVSCAPEGNVGHWSSEIDAGESDQDANVTDAAETSDASCADSQDCGSSALGAKTLQVTVIPGLMTTYFSDGRSLPAGEYTLTYVDGCWRSGVVSWTVNLGGEGYHVVGAEPEQRLAMAPGSVGTFTTLGAFGTYEECVAANVGRPGVSFRFGGGRIGLKLESLDPLTLFISLQGGETVGGRSPTFALRCVADCGG